MNQTDTKQILQKRFNKLSKHYEALRDYKSLINNLLLEKNIYEQFTFNTLKPEEKAILDAYLKRFSSIQDFLGVKIFPLLLIVAGINSSKMSEVLYYIEKEEIIDSFEKIENYYLNSLNFAKKIYKMRLENIVLNKIKEAIYDSFGEVKIYLFGSRVDDTKKGGDIDIAIDTNLDSIEFRRRKIKFLTNLFKKDFHLKIDIVNLNTKDELLKKQVEKDGILI